MHVRTRHFTAINLPLDRQVGVGFNASGGPNGGDPAGQIQPGETDRHLVEDRIARRIEHVLVHADEAWNHAVSMQVDDLRIFRNHR